MARIVRSIQSNPVFRRICVIFATLRNSFRPATVQDKFSIPMLRIYYNRVGCHHEISSRQALYRARWPQDQR